ncbi:MAG: hypothetical protein M3132_09830 [Actinomycetia bacterium]|nr:hypothetical protein [Actinomycetes bacterium]
MRTRTVSLITSIAMMLFAAWVTLASPNAVQPAFAGGLSDPSILTVQEGTLNVAEDGAVIENLEIRGALRITGKNVTVRNVWVYTSGPWTILVNNGGSATFDNIEIGNASARGERGIGGSNITARNLHIHYVEDGIKLGSNTSYSGVTVHDLYSPKSGPHSDAVQIDGGTSNATISNSSLSSLGPSLGNAAVFIKSDLGPISNVTIKNSYLNGGNYMNAVRDGGNGIPTGIRFINNRIGDDYRYGITRFQGDVEWTGNVWASTGEPAERGGENSGATTTTTNAPVSTITTTTPVSAPTTTAPATDTSSEEPETSSDEITVVTTTIDETIPPPTTMPQAATTTAPPSTTTSTTTVESGFAAPFTPPPGALPTSDRGALGLQLVAAAAAIVAITLAGYRLLLIRR